MSASSYKITFILNLHATKRTLEQLISWLKETVTGLGATVEKVEDLGVKDFVRVTSKANPNGHFLAFFVKASGDFNTAIQAKLKLETEVKRVYVESVETSAKA